jgi:large subunit ribosomal protein L9
VLQVGRRVGKIGEKGLEGMKILLLKDVYKLGRAGDVKRVADGYGRNYLLPQGLAVLATPGALKLAESIREEAGARRRELNQEMGSVAERLKDQVLTFQARASETGKLYGSITTQMMAEALSQKAGVEITRRQIDAQPVRALGEHSVHVRLTMDLVPEVRVIVHREGEAIPEQVEGSEPGQEVELPAETTEPEQEMEFLAETSESEQDPELPAESGESNESDAASE